MYNYVVILIFTSYKINIQPYTTYKLLHNICYSKSKRISICIILFG